ncbi:MAG TPA: TetR/AcrR family transcriptional regulator [Aggregatilineales bacterium]|nr:TetR/AcrR family transcriptional regulator [Anaerolineales bacterium]HRE48018.1 TetR/AcrR family transcriptional regulator [Aggregatilineales bacterium]
MGTKGEGKKSARELILESAAALFFRDGFRAVGVDTIIERSNVAKMTLYRHFPSKDDLIVAYLKQTDELFWVWFEESAAKGGDDPREQLIAFFKALEKLVTSPQCYGCPFLNAAVDFPNESHPGHQVALEHKGVVRTRFADLARGAGARAPETLGDQLLLLMDGAFMAVRMFGANNPAAHVAEAAAALIAAQLTE